MRTPPVRALLIADAKPGHYHQAEGVLAAIARIRPVETTRIEVGRRLVPSRILQQLVNVGAPPSLVLRLGYGIGVRNLPPADVVVSAGGETLAANAAAAKALSATNIFCGTLRRLAPEHVQLVLVPNEKFRSLPNHLVTLPPSSTELERAMGGWIKPAGLPARVGVLVGGDTRHIAFTADNWRRLMCFLDEAHATRGMRWLITTSRRTGSRVADMLAAMARDPASGIERFIDYRTSGAGTVAQILAAADAILVTADSTSMITESVAARLPVVGIAPEGGVPEEREAEYRAFLARRGWYRSLAFSDLTVDKFLAALSEVTPRQTSAIDELAKALSKRLPGLFSRKDAGPTPTT